MKHLVGGFNLFEKYESNWIISPTRGENEKKWNHHLDTLVTHACLKKTPGRQEVLETN